MKRHDRACSASAVQPLTFIDALIPRLCHGCGEPLHKDDVKLCPVCSKSLITTGFMTEPGNMMEQRLAGRVEFDKASAVFYYSSGSLVSRIVKDFKYHNFPSLARYMGERMYDEMCYCDIFSGIDAIVPMPIHWSRRLRRGYNQSEMLAEGLGGKSGIPVARLLKARLHTSQTRRSRSERLNAVDNKYYTVKGAAEWRGHGLLLVDDVCTTGSTVVAAVRALRDGIGDVRVSVLTLCLTN